MRRRVCGTTVALLLTLAPAVWSQQFYLYSPKAVVPEEKGEGVLVEEIPIKKGDTLYQLSRRFSGHGSYYSQILLFNDIKNPNLIYAGKTIRVPVSGEKGEETKPAAQRKHKTHAKAPAKPAAAAKKTAPVAKAQPAKTPDAAVELPLSELKRLDKDKAKHKQLQKSSAKVAGPKSQPAAEKPKVAAPKAEAPQPQSTASQQLFERAVRAYRQDDCKTALDLFDRFLANNASSPLAADASLYKAECYLKLSAQ